MLRTAFQELVKFFTLDKLQQLILVIVIGVAGFFILRFLSVLVNRMTRKYLSQQQSMLLRKAIQYTGAVLILFVILSVLGVKITALLGAAGIVGIAVGFAAQTSMSNLISGLFLISEKPFQIGDVIKVGDKTGVILSIDLLSVKIQTFDNQYIRFPNSLLITTEFTNVTRFPVRRLDIKFTVSYRTDVSQLKKVLLSIAGSNSFCLDEPEPLIVFADFKEAGLEFLFGVWFYKTDFLDLKNSIMQQIKERFESEGIRFSFPHRTLETAGSSLPLSLVEQAAPARTPRAAGRDARRTRPGTRKAAPGAK